MRRIGSNVAWIKVMKWYTWKSLASYNSANLAVASNYTIIPLLNAMNLRNSKIVEFSRCHKWICTFYEWMCKDRFTVIAHDAKSSVHCFHSLLLFLGYFMPAPGNPRENELSACEWVSVVLPCCEMWSWNFRKLTFLQETCSFTHTSERASERNWFAKHFWTWSQALNIF